MYYDVIPKVIYKSEDNYKPTLAIRINLGMFIGKEIN